MKKQQNIDVVIPRRLWSRGCLCREWTGSACVLGHVALTLGIPEGRLEGRDNYNHLTRKERAVLPKLLRGGTRRSDEYLTAIMSVNDDIGLEREQILSNMLQEAGVQLHFVDSVDEGAALLAKIWSEG